MRILFPNKQAFWNNVAWAACLGRTKLALCYSASSQMIVCHQGGMLKDVMVGFVSIQTVCYLLWVYLCKAWT